MRARLLMQTLFFFLALGSAFPQAATEAALANAHSAATTTKVGTILSDSLNKTTSKIAEPLKTASQPQTLPRATTRPVRSVKSSAAPTVAGKAAKPVSNHGVASKTISVASTGTGKGANSITIQGGCASSTSTTPSCPH